MLQNAPRLGHQVAAGATGPPDVELTPDPPVCWAWSTSGAAEPGAAPLPGGGGPAQQGRRVDLLLATVSGAVHRVPVVPDEPRPFWVTMPQVGHAASPAGMLACMRSHACGKLSTCGQSQCFRVFA